MGPRCEQAPDSLPDGHWLETVKELLEIESIPLSPMSVRAVAILTALGIPWGESSALNSDARGKRMGPEKDRIIAEMLTNHPGVWINRNLSIYSHDFRDIYPNGLPDDLRLALDPETEKIMSIEYRHLEQVRDSIRRNEQIDDGPAYSNFEEQIAYSRLPGGIDVFLRGYQHNPVWQKNHGVFLKQANRHARIICIEHKSGIAKGNNLAYWWQDTSGSNRHYDFLMRDAVAGGFQGLFAEVDARDDSRIRMDNLMPDKTKFPDLPAEFFEKYYRYLSRESPYLSSRIGSYKKLEKVLRAQSTTKEGLLYFRPISSEGGINRFNSLYYYNDKGYTITPNYLELGQNIFGNALTAIKIHLLAKLMADGKLGKRGPIIDYQGSAHLLYKSFFLRYPRYAMEVVLRTINELMAGGAKRSGDLAEIYEVFDKPNWPEILKEIVKLPIKQVEDDPKKGTEPGSKQKKLAERSPDIFSIYGIDATKVVPGDEEIEKMTGQINAKFHGQNYV